MKHTQRTSHPQTARVVKLVDTTDLRSVGQMAVRVRVPPRVLKHSSVKKVVSWGKARSRNQK